MIGQNDLGKIIYAPSLFIPFCADQFAHLYRFALSAHPLFLVEGLSFLVIRRTTACTPAYKTVEK